MTVLENLSYDLEKSWKSTYEKVWEPCCSDEFLEIFAERVLARFSFAIFTVIFSFQFNLIQAG